MAKRIIVKPVPEGLIPYNDPMPNWQCIHRTDKPQTITVDSKHVVMCPKCVQKYEQGVPVFFREPEAEAAKAAGAGQ